MHKKIYGPIYSRAIYHYLTKISSCASIYRRFTNEVSIHHSPPFVKPPSSKSIEFDLIRVEKLERIPDVISTDCAAAGVLEKGNHFIRFLCRVNDLISTLVFNLNKVAETLDRVQGDLPVVIDPCGAGLVDGDTRSKIERRKIFLICSISEIGVSYSSQYVDFPFFIEMPVLIIDRIHPIRVAHAQPLPSRGGR